jgi:hypothetical protein
MAEENKAEKKEDQAIQKGAGSSQPKVEIKQEPPQAPQATSPAKPAEVKKEGLSQKKARPANCAVCNKSIRKKRWYYRNGNYYCSKRCWKTTVKKEEAKPQQESEVKK